MDNLPRLAGAARAATLPQTRCPSNKFSGFSALRHSPRPGQTASPGALSPSRVSAFPLFVRL